MPNGGRIDRQEAKSAEENTHEFLGVLGTLAVETSFDTSLLAALHQELPSFLPALDAILEHQDAVITELHGPPGRVV